MTSPSRTVTEAFRIILPIVILCVAVGGFIVLKNSKESPAAAAPTAEETVVETVAVVAHPGNINIVVTGEVVPFREVNIAAEVAGRVVMKEAICETGRFVNKDDVLFQIDAQDYEFEKRRLEKELDQSNAYLKELDQEIEGMLERIQVADQEVASAESEYDRQLKLKGIASDSQIDRANREYLAAQNARIQIDNQLRLLRTRESRLKSGTELVQVQLERAALDLTRTTVKSPATGVITSEHVQQDDYVQKGATLVTIEDTSQAEVTCHLDAEDEQWIWLSHPELLKQRNDEDEPWRDYELPETKAKVIYKRGKLEYEWDGLLTHYDGLGFDPKTRTIPCRVVVKDPRHEHVRRNGANSEINVGPRALVRGMHVTVELITAPKVRLFRIPSEAIQPGNRVWTVVYRNDSSGSPKMVLQGRRVVIVDQFIDRAIDGTSNQVTVVYSPDNSLSATDTVVVSPLSTPHDGMPVTFGEATE